ncbi:hypothetical protein ACFUT3_14470 [Streptomyces cinereoruber]|uniref:hypothetical protein n=1 Tax=Streptomyces cinereoruber TaxID=67260 RepID=UPI00363808A6
MSGYSTASSARAYSGVCNSPYTTCVWNVEMYVARASNSATGWNQEGSRLRSTRPISRENVPPVQKMTSPSCCWVSVCASRRRRSSQP